MHEPRPPRQASLPLRPAAGGAGAGGRRSNCKPGQKREEIEGVFMMKDGKAAFVIVKPGIAGERYLEVSRGSRKATG